MPNYNLRHFSAQSDAMPSTLQYLNADFVDYNCNIIAKNETNYEAKNAKTIYVYESYRFPSYFGYADLVNGLIRLYYTLSDELALNRQRDAKPDEFKAYSSKCDACKDLAKEIVKAMENSQK